jgi:kinetochore protein NDC80
VNPPILSSWTDETDKLLEQLHAELVTIETQVAAQNLSPDEVNRMNHERESLTKQLHDLRSKIAEATQYAFDQELSVTKSMDRFDQHLTDYTSFAHQIGTMTPSEGPFMGPGGVDYSIDLELGLGDVNEIQASGRKMREIIRPALNKYDEDIRIQTRVVGEEQAGLDGELDKLGMTVEQQKADASNKNLELRKKLTEAEAARAVSLDSFQEYTSL